jgi:hypothetical protein
MGFGHSAFSTAPFSALPDDGAPAVPNFGWFGGFSNPSRPVWPRSAALAASGDAPRSLFQADAAETIHLDKWFNPGAVPIRFLRSGWGYGATLAVSGESSRSLAQFVADNATARWHRPLSEPKRFLRDPRHAATMPASGEPARALHQFESDNANVRWQTPFSEPRRFARDPRFAATLAAGALNREVALPAPAFDWHAAMGEPRRFLRDGWRYGATLVAAGDTPRTLHAFEADNANVRWHRPFGEPVGRNRAAIDRAGIFLVPQVDVAAETITVDKWFNPGAIPVRFRGDFRHRILQAGPLDRPVVLPAPAFDWHVPLAGPKRFPREGPRSHASLAASGMAPRSIAAFVGDAAHVRWLAPWVQPTRRRPFHAAAASGARPEATAYYELGRVNPGWYVALREPTRRRSWRAAADAGFVPGAGYFAGLNPVHVDWLTAFAQPRAARSYSAALGDSIWFATSADFGAAVADEWYIRARRNFRR